MSSQTSYLTTGKDVTFPPWKNGGHDTFGGRITVTINMEALIAHIPDKQYDDSMVDSQILKQTAG